MDDKVILAWAYVVVIIVLIIIGVAMWMSGKDGDL